MNLHEYQSKQLLHEAGVPAAEGVVVRSVGEVAGALEKIGGDKWVVKVQVHAGGRGKAGGVKLVDSAAEAEEFARRWLGQKMTTYQSGGDGLPVNAVLIEPCTDIERELYLAAILDRDTRRIVIMASAEGGVEIEAVAARDPEAIKRSAVDLIAGPMPWQGRELAHQLGLSPAQGRQMGDIVVRLVNLMLRRDLTLIEINPLVVTGAGDLFCLDAKFNVDEGALHRQAGLVDMRDKTQEDEREMHAAEWSLNYVALDGSIGCMVNGAGLAMATMDMIQINGGAPANFLDVGGGTTSERVTEAFKIILSDQAVRVILINIFGGIVRCDLIAEGVLKAIADVGVGLPVVVRLQGNRHQQGLKMIADGAPSSAEIYTEVDLQRAAERCVELAGEKRT
ncbi:MAG: ADP-forming succinate--CoA ligase subunit beta [Gammaproteobacteria bacterium AqS3]|nr:ADP-forming succinate--CoA ligase subunit beta [Gammaproteobacteria bacterium AqS3]